MPGSSFGSVSSFFPDYTPIQDNLRLNREADMVRLLLAHGASNINVHDVNGFSLLMWASYHGYADIVKTLLARGVDLTAFDDEESYTALRHARDGNHPQIVQMLQQAGAKK